MRLLARSTRTPCQREEQKLILFNRRLPRKRQPRNLHRDKKPRPFFSHTSPLVVPQELTGLKCTVPVCTELSASRRRQIIAAYGRILKKYASSVERESILPYPKDLIRLAIHEELLENPETELANHLEIAFAQLEAFLPEPEYQILQQFKAAGKMAETLAQSGNPEGIIKSARVLRKVKGDRAVRIQEKISQKMWARLKEIRAIRISGFGVAAGQCPSTAQS